VLSDNPEVKKLTSNVNKQIQTDNSFGLKKTYCAALIQGKVNDTELVRPSDCFVDDYAATKAKLAEEGYESICIFEDYVKNTKTADSESVKEQYLQICEELYMEEQYRQLATKIINEEKAGKKFGYQALCVLKETLEQWSGTYSEKAKLVLYLEEKIHESIGKNGKPKYGQRGFAGLKKWVHICLFETEGRRKERIAQLGEVISWNALEAGYNNRAFAKLPTATFYEDRLRKAKPLDCAIATFFTAVIIFLLQEFHLITWINVALPVCLWLLFIVCNRREKGLLRMIQLSACYATAGLGGIVFYCNAEKWIAHENFLVINGLTLVLTIVVLLFIKEKKCFRNIFLSRVIWMVPITCYMLFTLMALEWFTDIKYGLVLITCCQMVILLISLYGLNKSENMRFNRKSFTNEKTLMGISAMLILVGAVVLVLSEELMSVAGIGSIMLLIFSAIASFLVGALTTNSEKNIIKAIGLAFMISTGYLVCLMLHGFLHYLLPLGKILSLVISEIIYLIMTVILCMAVVIDETTSSEINTKI